MRLRFLCPHHRSLIEADPSRARSSWESSHAKALLANGAETQWVLECCQRIVSAESVGADPVPGHVLAATVH